MQNPSDPAKSRDRTSVTIAKRSIGESGENESSTMRMISSGGRLSATYHPISSRTFAADCRPPPDMPVMRTSEFSATWCGLWSSGEIPCAGVISVAAVLEERAESGILITLLVLVPIFRGGILRGTSRPVRILIRLSVEALIHQGSECRTDAISSCQIINTRFFNLRDTAECF